MKKLFLLILILPFVSWAQVDSLDLKKSQVWILNGEIVSEEIIEKLDPETIKSIERVKEGDPLFYHHKKHGPISITTKDFNLANSDNLNNSLKESDLKIISCDKNIFPKDAFYVIDGSYSTIQNVRVLNPNNIENIEIFKNQGILHHSTKDVIVITTKNSNYKTEYDLSVLDLGYESFLKMQPSAGAYSLSYLQNRNQRYVSLWNERVLTGDPKIYEMAIDYDSQAFYGLEFEHKLFMFFKFMEKKHSISML